MITTEDVYCILHDVCGQFDIKKIYGEHNIPTGNVETERIVIRTGSQSNGEIWEKSFVNINFCVPNLFNGGANTIRLQEIERMVKPVFKRGGTVYYKGSNCDYENGGDNWLSTEEDAEIKCHYVNVRILFKVLNVD